MNSVGSNMNSEHSIPFPSTGLLDPQTFTITVDTEEEWDWRLGFRANVGSTANILGIPKFQETCERYGAKVTYFVNYSALASPHSGVLKDLSQNPNAEIGLHYHPWNTPPLAKEKTIAIEHTFLANLNWDLAEKKLDSIFDQFDRLGIIPRSFRGGRYSTSDQIQKYLSKRGIRADCSLFPFCQWNEPGAPEYSRRGFEIKRKSFAEDNSFLWEIPLTRGFTRGDWILWSHLFLLLSQPPWRMLRGIGILDRLGITKQVWLNFEEFLGSQNYQLRKVLNRLRLPTINFTLHSSSLIAGGNLYVPTATALDKFYRNLEHTLSWLENDRIYQSVTVTELVNKLERYYHACSGN
jgi:hypothetical protein